MTPRTSAPTERADGRSFTAVRVLLVEDDPVNAVMATTMLTCLGCVVEAAAHGKEALAVLEKTAFDLILMDCQMPVMDGYETTVAIRKCQMPHIPIVALTASARVEDYARALEVGMDDYLTKPIGTETLSDALARWLPLVRRGPTLEVVREMGPEPHHTYDALPIFDVREALDRTGEWNVLVEALNVFREHWGDLWPRLTRALETGSARDLEALAHRIKGAAGSLSAKRMAAHARDAEAMWTLGRLHDAEQRIEMIVSAADDLLAEADRLSKRGAVA